MAANTPHTAFRLPPDVKAAAARLAAEQGMSLTEAVVALLRLWLTQPELLGKDSPSE